MSTAAVLWGDPTPGQPSCTVCACARLHTVAGRPVARCTAYVKLWSDIHGGTMNQRAAGSYTPDLGVTFWRPLPPMGYAVLGHCATQNGQQPAFQVAM